MSTLRLGYLYGFGAYLIWGFFPIYFKLLRPAGPVEILAHRVVWSVVFVAAAAGRAAQLAFLRALLRRPRAARRHHRVAAVLIAVNWGTYIYGVNSDRVVETSLGYFINPLVTGAARGRRAAGAAAARRSGWRVGVGGLAVAVLTVDYGRLPYIALILAVQLRRVRPGQEAARAARRRGALRRVGGAGRCRRWATWAGCLRRAESTFGHVSAGHTVLLVLAGAATAIPLLLFAGAANRLPMSASGILQYVAPILQLGCGVLIYHEPMPPARLAGFALVWLALVVFTVDAFRATRKRNRAARLEKSAAAVTPA